MGKANFGTKLSSKEKKLLSNISTVENGHQKLAEVHSHIKLLIRTGGNKNDLTEIFFALSYFFENYLIKEELLLRKAGYSNLKKHSSSHKEFMHEIVRLKDNVDKNAEVVLKKLDEFIASWLINHELTFNEELNKYLK
jgi:hemerythrin-like metal-binding protein